VRTHPASAGIAGLCFLACGLIVAFAYLSTLFRVYAPSAREWLIELAYAASEWMTWLMVPQFGMGILFAFLTTTLCLFVVSWKRP
jgi:hypothetical protein